MEHIVGRSTLRVALYGRVSTVDKGQDVNLQLNELRDYSERRGWKIAGEYVDNGVSGAKESRPELNRLMADAKKRRFDAIAVWKLDRFGRSLKHLVMTLADLESLGVAFVSLRDGFDLSTPSGRLMFQIIGAMCGGLAMGAFAWASPPLAVMWGLVALRSVMPIRDDLRHASSYLSTGATDEPPYSW